MRKPDRYRTLLDNTLFLGIGTFGSKLLTLVMVRFYTGVLTPSDYGVADLIMQTANLLLPLVSLGITNGVFRFAMEQQEQRSSVFSAGLYTTAAGTAALLAAAPMLASSIGLTHYAWLICGYTVASCCHSLCAQYIRAEGKTVLFAVQGMMNTALVIGFNLILLLAVNMGVTGYVLSVVLADSACAVYLFFKERLWRLVIPKLDKNIFRQMLRYSIPLIPTTVFWWITSVSDRYMVALQLGTEASGLYAVACKIPTVLTLLSTIFMEAWQYSAVSEAGEQSHTRFYTQVWRAFAAVMLLSGSMMIALCRVEIRVLSAPRYYIAWQYVPTLTIAMAFSAFASFMGSVFVVTKQSVRSLWTALWGACANIALNLLLIPRMGIQGAAIATALSYLLCFAVRAASARRLIPFDLCVGRLLLGSALLTVQAVLAFCTHPLQPVGQTTCFLLLLVLNWQPLAEVYQKIRGFRKEKE